MDNQRYKKELQKVKVQLESSDIDEIPLTVRPKMPEYDPNEESYVVVSYSRKDFEKVYLFLAYLFQEGYRFWYDNGMQGTSKWLTEFKEKYDNPNCLGTITFFSEDYISDSTKEELAVIYDQDQYKKQNIMISLVSLSDIDPDKILKKAIINDRISIQNAGEIMPVLSNIIAQEKEKTIHRYGDEEDIPYLVEKLSKVFDIRSGAEKQPQTIDKDKFWIVDGVLRKYIAQDENVIIPDGVTEIGVGAFSSCLDVKSVVIPEGVTIIHEYAFQNCFSLSSVTIPSSVTEIHEGAFQSCYSLTSLVIPDNVTLIGDCAFDSCYDLETVTMSKSIRNIYHDAFYCCLRLKSMTICDSLVFIGNNVFEGCELLEYIVYEGTKLSWKMVECGDIGVHLVKCIDGEVEVY